MTDPEADEAQRQDEDDSAWIHAGMERTEE